ncbi:MAG: reactive intermediate/imine deaminase [Deltaproteobacteria bacterium]|nr:reactive intermediate/imine deaminase [Deltaproteobacteria bacterium]
MSREAVNTDAAPKAIGPYVQAIKTNGFLYTSGQIALDPKTGELIQGDIIVQTRQALTNLKAVLEAGGSSLDRVIKATIFLKSMGDFATVNKIYEEFLGDSKPARSTVAVADLPKGALVEIDFIALA